ncbi:sodium:proton antiporter [Pedosphaera parvula]|uniref:Citrate transporter n=1 Tax=Pedosphaera parvula (strain Ellin514) TaxID=320771 RepID=B9XG74_PEDPL|nr:sodium:proton antiporter [Pedosphaera parvula]EEF61236.1 Citrate transporter [Pedosphaera parvula Ellin514]
MENAIVPHPLAMLPFSLLLAAIALAPLFFADWWGKHYPKICLILASIVVVYYCVGLNASSSVLHTAREYISFIALVGSLFVVSGGIHIGVKGESTPLANVLFLLVGALLANVLGTTGASMLLIRPWIRMNKYRITTHHITFFIFIISNVGGCLTPVGDPPLFLGYLSGVPFWWVMLQGWPIWLTGVGILLVMFYFVDSHNYHRAPKPVREHLTGHEKWTITGTTNLLFLAIIFAAVFVSRPFLLREMLMVAAATASYFITRKEVHEANHFNLNPVKEVAILFIAIFATMLPALDWLAANASKICGAAPATFYFGSGTLSSVLDNAPTYLSFLNALFGVTGTHDVHLLLAQSPKVILAISIGSVFFGANTYIGNGPNFMVKAIADQQHVHTPTFGGYILRHTIPFMLPMILIVWFIFFRHAN